jgi:hypothetical protein
MISRLPSCLAAACLLAAHIAVAQPQHPAFPGKEPGRVTCQSTSDGATLGNEALSASWTFADGHLRPGPVVDRLNGRTLPAPEEAFVLVFRDGKTTRELKASEMTARSSGTPRVADRLPGKGVLATLEAADGTLRVQWQATMLDGSNYIRQQITIEPLRQNADIARVVMVRHALPDAKVCGTVDGSPIVAGPVFTGYEHPMSKSQVKKGPKGEVLAEAWLERALPLAVGKTFQSSSVIGTTPPGQLRRGFLYYVERQRAHRYRTFLHYNSWYDIGYFTPFNEADCLDSIHAFATELGQKRGVKLDSFLFDDGWDDKTHGGQWNFHSGFPHGFTPLLQAAAACGAAPGVWLSPWGGYGPPRKQRLDSGMKAGFETDGNKQEPGFALSGPKYYAQFHKACETMLTKYGINQFKLDGTGNINTVVPGSQFGSDFEAAIQLIRDLRAIKPDLYINLTTGTWPSPFWLTICDSIWRGGEDHSFAGVGTPRQRWITYRDGDTYHGVVLAGPLYPINSLMLHGMIFAKHAHDLNKDPGGDFRDEARSYFATGTQLQEMYISHGLLSAQDWDTLAECAKWSRANAGTLVDSHWIGGDPLKLHVYGWASWSAGDCPDFRAKHRTKMGLSPSRDTAPPAAKGIFALRNPSDKPQKFTVDLAKFFELPVGAPTCYRVTSPYKQRAIAELAGVIDAAQPVEITLRPFEVLVFEALP